MGTRIEWGRYSEEETIETVVAGLRALPDDAAITAIRQYVIAHDENAMIPIREELACALAAAKG